MEPFAMKPQPGSPLLPAAVIGRDQTIRTALAQLRAGNNLVLTDPRRMGKTALLRRLCNAPGPKTLAVMIDYEGVASTEEFLLRTVGGLRTQQEVWKRVGHAAKVFFEGFEGEVGVIKVKTAFARKAPEALLIDVIGGVNARLGSGEMLIVAMDEVPLAIDNIVASQGPGPAGQILQAMRRLRQAQPSSVRWIVTGSVGFHHVIRRAQVTEGLINDLMSLPLGPLEPADAALLARCLLLGIEREAEPGGIETMVSRSGAIPFLVHQLAHILSDGADAVTGEEVERAFGAFVADRDQSRAVTHLLTRLGPNFGELSRLAHRILDATAARGPLTASELIDAVADDEMGDRDHFLAVIDDLCDDHYLVFTQDERWRWRYDILQEIWRRRRNLS